MTTSSTTACTSCSKPTAGAALCERCTKTLDMALANVAAYYADAGSVVRTRQTRYGSGVSTRGSIGKEQPLPVDGRFLDVNGSGTQARWDTWNTIVTWCRVVMAEQPQLHGPDCRVCLHTSCHAVRRRRWPSNNVPSMCAYLQRQFRLLVSEPWAAALLDELTSVEHRLGNLIDRPADTWYAGKCSQTDESGNTCEAELYARADRGTIRCPACDTQHDVAERRDFLLKEAKTYLVTAVEAAGALLAWTDYDGSEAKLVDRIRKWHDRDRLIAHGTTAVNGRDRNLYRLGDVQELLILEAQRAQDRRLSAGGRR